MMICSYLKNSSANDLPKIILSGASCCSTLFYLSSKVGGMGTIKRICTDGLSFNLYIAVPGQQCSGL